MNFFRKKKIEFAQQFLTDTKAVGDLVQLSSNVDAARLSMALTQIDSRGSARTSTDLESGDDSQPSEQRSSRLSDSLARLLENDAQVAAAKAAKATKPTEKSNTVSPRRKSDLALSPRTNSTLTRSPPRHSSHYDDAGDTSSPAAVPSTPKRAQYAFRKLKKLAGSRAHHSHVFGTSHTLISMNLF